MTTRCCVARFIRTLSTVISTIYLSSLFYGWVRRISDTSVDTFSFSSVGRFHCTLIGGLDANHRVILYFVPPMQSSINTSNCLLFHSPVESIANCVLLSKSQIGKIFPLYASGKNIRKIRSIKGLKCVRCYVIISFEWLFYFCSPATTTEAD